MDWVQIGSALFLGAMLVFIYPRMRAASKNSPKGSNKEWMNFAIIILVVAAFVMLLIKMV
jgi:hypothetical protein